MNKHYFGQLQIEANVPVKDIFKDLINVTVDFEIICPYCGPECQNIKKNGRETEARGKIQKFYCKTKNKSFYPHTSWIFKEFTTVILEDVMECLFVKNLPPKAVADKFNISQSLVSKIRYNCFDLLQKKIDYYQTELKELKDLKKIPLDLLSAIWWDETYFKVNGEYFCLILIIDAFGGVLGYKFSKTRKDYDYLSILEPIKHKLPEIPIFICDGFKTYESVVKKLERESYLIQHIHSKPWKNVKLHHFNPDFSSKEIEIHTLLLQYDSFLQEKHVEGYAIKKRVAIKDPNTLKKCRGRPKGSKDTKKRVKHGSKKGTKTRTSPQKRGPKNITESGLKLRFLPKPKRGHWCFKHLSPDDKIKNADLPNLNVLSKMLTKTYIVMGGKSIQSNLIESKNSVVKRLINKPGLKNVYQRDYLLGTHLLARGEIEECYWKSEELNVNFKNTLGFNNMLRLFTPDKTKIEVF